VLEEIQNLARSIQTRAIDWRKLGFWGGVKTGLIVVDRLLENLLLRAEQMSGAMAVRGFTAPDRHRVLWHESKLRKIDSVAIGLMLVAWAIRIIWGGPGWS
jgi:energy-coupling factor transport system permease protein